MRKILVVLSCLLVALLADNDEWDKFDNFDEFVPKYPSNLRKDEVLLAFLKYAEDYKMNITAVVQETTNWSNGGPKKIEAITITFPTINEQLTQSNYNKDVAYTFLKAAAMSKVTANARFVDVKAGDRIETDSEHFVSNNIQWVPDSLAYRVLTNVQEGIKGYIPTDAAHFARYNFITEKNETTQVLFADVYVSVKETSEFSDEETEFAKQTVRDYVVLVDDDEECARMIVEAMDEKYPKWNWNAFVGGGKFALHSKKYAVFHLFDTDYTIVGVEQKEAVTEQTAK